MGLPSNPGSFLSMLPLLFLIAASTTNAKDFSVMTHGANDLGTIDSTKAFNDTWTEACASPEPAKFVVPRGTFLVGPMKFEGPCNATVDFVIQGTIKAPADPAQFPTPEWIVFHRLTGTTISGGGTFDGQGQQAWKANDCAKNTKCHALPINIRFNNLNHTHVSQITSVNSKSFNVNIVGCNNITLDQFKVTNPGDAPNTDGIHMGESTGVTISNTQIATGDDCVSIGPGSIDVMVTGVMCGPGHGISIGSLGKYENEHDVTGITVRNCTLTNTKNGVRVKSWAKAKNSAANAKSKASDFIFEDIFMRDVQNPIVIDQLYCPYVECSQSNPSQVEISNVTFNRIMGTTTTKNAISIVCSKGVPCKGVNIGDVNLRYTGTNGTTAESLITFTTPTITGTQNLAINVLNN